MFNDLPQISISVLCQRFKFSFHYNMWKRLTLIYYVLLVTKKINIRVHWFWDSWFSQVNQAFNPWAFLSTASCAESPEWLSRQSKSAFVYQFSNEFGFCATLCNRSICYENIFLAFTENFICCYIDSCFLILTLLQASSSKYMWWYIPRWFASLAHTVGKFISWFLKLLKRFLRILHLNNHAFFK